MSKYLKTKDGSLESAVLEAVSRAQQAAIAIAKKEKEEESVEEKANFSDKEVKMAIGIASDKRYAGGNYTGAVKTIEKIKKGLSDHPQVKAVLKRQNEEKSECPQCKGEGCDHCDGKGYHMSEGSKEEYEKFFKAALKKFGVDSPADFKSDEEKKKFFDYVDKNYKGEKSEQVEEGYKPVKKDHYDVKVTVSDKDVDAVKKYIMNSRPYNNGDIEDVDSDQVDGGGMKFKGTGDIYIQGDGAGELGVELQKKFRNKIKVMGEETIKEEVSLAQLAADHITKMWKESAGVSKKKVDNTEEKDDNDEVKGQTMTGKPLNKIEISPKDKE